MKYKGLSTTQVRKRLEKYGENQLHKEKKFSIFRLLIEQFTSPLIYILLFAAIITFFLHEYVDMSIILLAVFINTVLGFIQEFKAQNSLEKLSEFLSPKATVIRNGTVSTISAINIVPGDIVLLEAGEQVPADGVVLEAREFTVNEALLTGESVPVRKEEQTEKQRNEEMKKQENSVSEIDISLDCKVADPHEGEAKNFVYMGTTCVSGKATVRILTTGQNTQMGKISKSLSDTKEEETPLQQRLSTLSKQLAVLVGVVSVLIFVFGIIMDKPWFEMFTLSVAIAVSAIPEGLVVSLTVILAIGMQRILKRKALVRKLVAAETLGGVSVICADKTGTITKGELQVMTVKTKKKKLMKEVASLLTSATDHLEIAIREWRGDASVSSSFELLDEVPFSSSRKYSVKLTKDRLFVIGAPEVVAKHCSKKDQAYVEHEVENITQKGYRVVGVATRKSKKGETSITLSRLGKLKWTGLFVFSDPVRKNIKSVFKQAQKAGIDIKIITGDYARTAQAVLSEVGLEVDQSEVLLGTEFKVMSRSQLKQKIQKTKLFARTTPDQKLIIVQTLQEMGEVVAMTGDGVNDAPALKKADIGVVVSSATDVSKQTADMVLLNNNFKTIMAAVEEGRGIFENLRKLILYLLSDSFTEVILVIGSLLLGLPLPITAAQILWVNLVNDGFPTLALTVDPNDGKEMLQQKPRKRSGHLIDSEVAWLIALISIVTGCMILGAFWFLTSNYYSPDYARTIAFTMLGVDSLVYVFSSRSLRHPIWKEGIFKNLWLLGAVVIGFFFQLSVLYVPFLQDIFATHPLTLGEWGMVLASSFAVLVLVEGVKMFFCWKQENC